MQLYRLVLLTHVAVTSIEFAKSQLEWASDLCRATFEQSGSQQNPFDLPHVHKVSSLEELDRLPGPQVVLATGHSMAAGSLSHELLLRWGKGLSSD